jgi:hypothetical protein
VPAGRARLTLAVLAFAGLLALAIAFGGAGALLMAPALLAAVPFLLGRYPGEALLQRLRSRPARRHAPVPRRLPRAARGGFLRPSPLASRGASRAPPALLLR